MDGGLEIRCVGRVYGANGTMQHTAPFAPYTRYGGKAEHIMCFTFLSTKMIGNTFRSDNT